MQKLVFILCGLPGSGKSTWRERFVAEFDSNEKPYTVSTDDVVEEWAKQLNQTYAETWLQMREQLEPMLMAQMCEAMKHDKVVVDSTNLTAAKRNRIIDILGPDCKYFVVDFTGVGMPTILQRNKERAARGRSLPLEVLHSMDTIMEQPSPTLDGVILLRQGAVSEVIRAGGILDPDTGKFRGGTSLYHSSYDNYKEAYIND
jgi:tRNA uridine 5-carbamoylmethylation protein Kti12